MTTTSVRSIGTSQLRREDARLLAGAGRYVADVRLPETLYLAVARSEYAHAELGAVDLSMALSAPGVVDAFAASSIGPYNKPMPTRMPLAAGMEDLIQRPLARERVRYVGEPIAAVVAESRAAAEDAAGLVTAAYEPLEAVASIEAALAPEAPPLFPGRSNVVSAFELASGDVDAALGSAAVVISESFSIQRHTASPMETRGLLAAHDSNAARLSIWGVTKVPHHHRRVLAEMLGLDEDSIDCIATDVGGGFGVRGEFYPEDLLVPLASMRTGRPVQWIEDRREHLLGTNHSREMEWTLTAGLSTDGTLLALDAELRVDFGAYVRPLVDMLGQQAGRGLPGPYRLPNFRCRGRSVLTNKMGIGSMRSPGFYEATFARERFLDICAQRLGLDRAELRRRNLVTADELPYDTGIGTGDEAVVYDGGDYHATLETVLSEVEEDYRRLQERAAGSPRRIGLGFACAVEGTGWGQQESARVRCNGNGTFTVFTGAATMGQGHATALAQIVADALGVASDSIEVVHADTRLVPRGEGTFASRTMSMAGSAVWLASKDLVERLTGSMDQTEPIESTATYQFTAESFPFATSAALVEVDVELCTVRLVRYVVAADLGTVINPMLVRGQLAGAAVLGCGGALLEELSYDTDGQPMSTSFMDYLLPSSLDVPAIETILMDTGPATTNPLGVRGAGEIGTPGAGAAIANAVADALGPSAAPLTSLPLSPDRLLDLVTVGTDKHMSPDIG